MSDDMVLVDGVEGPTAVEEHEPFADEGHPDDGDASAALERLPEAEGAEEVGEDGGARIPPIAVTPEVQARICDCLRTAIAGLDAQLGHARELGERDAFYGGWAAVLEQRRTRYAVALERTLPLAEGAEPLAIGSEVEPAPEPVAVG